MDWNLNQDRSQDKEQGPLQKPAMDKDPHDPPSLKPSMTCMAWNTASVNMGSRLLSIPPCR